MYYGLSKEIEPRDALRMAKFEVIVYNKAVRDKVKEGERHRQFTDDWADLHYIEIDASNETNARERAEHFCCSWPLLFRWRPNRKTGTKGWS